MLFLLALLKKNERTPEDLAEIEEHTALCVLHRWGEMKEFLPGAYHLVPEHVEIRSLQSQENPGLPRVMQTNVYITVTTTVENTHLHWHYNMSLLFQGYLHMWVDMFPTDVPAPPPVDIKPRLPEQYVVTLHMVEFK